MSIETIVADEPTAEIKESSTVTKQLLGACATPPPDHIKSLALALDELNIVGQLDARGVNDVLNVFEGIPESSDTAYATVVAAMVHQRALPMIKRKIRV